MTDHIPAEVFPPIEFLRDAMIEREWSLSDLLDHMPGDRAVNEVSLGLLALEDPSISMDESLAAAIGAAIGTSAQLWLNLDASFRRCHAARS